MSDHVNKNFISSITGKHLLTETDKRLILKKEKESAEILRLQQVKLQEESNKQRFIAAHYEKLRNPYIPALSKDITKSLNESLGRHFSRLPKHLHEQVSSPSDWIPHNTPVGIFYVNQITGEWMNAFGHVALSLEDLLHATGEDMNSDASQRSTSSDIIPDTILPEPTSALDYAVWATTFVNSPTWQTDTNFAVVPMIALASNNNNGFRLANQQNASGVDLASLVGQITLVPDTRRVVSVYYLWDEMSSWTIDKHNYYKQTADGFTYSNGRFLNPWTDVQYEDVKQAVVSVLNYANTQNVNINYFCDDHETTDPLYGLQGYNTGYGLVKPTDFDVSGNPIRNFPSSGGWTLDARIIPAYMHDPRFNDFINPQNNKSVAEAFLDYYKTFTVQPGLSATAEQVLQLWYGITHPGDFEIAGLDYYRQFSFFGPSGPKSQAVKTDELYIRAALDGALHELVNGYYSTRAFTEAFASIPRFQNTIYSNYENYPIDEIEGEYARDSNDQVFLNPTFTAYSGGKGFYGNNGNIIWNSDGQPNYISGYISNPTTDRERYSWCGHNQLTYTGPGTLVRYANDNSDPLWGSKVAHKQFIDDVKWVRHMFRTDPSFWQTHTPWFGPGMGYSTNNSGRYWYEFFYHTVLHGVLYTILFQYPYVELYTLRLQAALDAWRVISNDSKSRACSNSTGDINSVVDRLVLGDAVQGIVKSGGKLLKSNKYLWRLTASHAHVRANNTIVFQRVGSDSDIPSEVIVDCSVPLNGYGIWIKRNISTPPQYVIVPE